MKIMLVGGNGFIGSNLILKLLAEGHTINVFVDASKMKSIAMPKDIKQKIKSIVVKEFSGIDKLPSNLEDLLK